MRITNSIAIAGTICLAFGAAAIAGDSPAVRSAAAPASANAGVPEQRKTSNAYRNAKARLAIARDRARQQLADARKDEAARKSH